MDEPLLFSVIAELAPKPMHGHAYDISCRCVIEAPDVLRDGRRRNDGVAVPHEVLEQTEFGTRETGRHPIEIERPLGGIEAEGADLEDR